MVENRPCFAEGYIIKVRTVSYTKYKNSDTISDGISTVLVV